MQKQVSKAVYLKIDFKTLSAKGKGLTPKIEVFPFSIFDELFSDVFEQNRTLVVNFDIKSLHDDHTFCST